MTRRYKKIPFKPYHDKQSLLFPPNIDNLVPGGHPVRIVDRILDKVDIQSILDTYPGGGSSGYHPRMLLKVLVYAYLRNIYSSRQIEEALKENIHFMWISGMSKPDHNTINRFRGKRLDGNLKEIFGSVVEMLAVEGYLNIKEIYIDGTKMEANANRYTFVWGKAAETQKEKIRQQLEEIWRHVQSVYEQEKDLPATPDFKEISPEKVETAIDQINEALKDKNVSSDVKKKLKYAAKNWPVNLSKYEEQEKILQGRNSYSKTDHDATFMRMKEDHMQNGQLKPAYNWQFSCNNQFVVNYTIEQTTTDTTTLIRHLDEHERLYGEYPEIATADSGYGSEENYQFMEENDIEAFVKFNYFHKEQSRKFKSNIFHKDNLYYNPEKDCYYCPMGQEMKKLGNGVRKTTTGFKQDLTYYKAQNCEGCPLRSGCHKGKGNRIIEINYNLERHKQIAREKLLSDEGVKRRKQRPADVEATFGIIKNNKGFRRLMLRGKRKVQIETGLVALAHNLAKISA